jgi:hypothetical protein
MNWDDGFVYLAATEDGRAVKVGLFGKECGVS